MAASAAGPNFSSFDTVTTTVPAQKPTTLSREVLRWLQSLDLAYSVKNVKRDFSNGFLVAEILSRYYDKDIQMHSYDNGMSIKVRKDNWKQLLKAFRRLSLSHIITEDEMNGIIHRQDGVVVTFLNRIYEVLTQRKVQEVIKRPLPEPVPAYARQTAVSIVGGLMKTAEVIESKDIISVNKVLQAKVGEHEAHLQEERQVDPDRFLQESKIMNPAEAKPKTVPMIKVKEIQVRQLNGSVTQLRASRDDQYGGLASSGAPHGAETATSPEAGLTPAPKPVTSPMHEGGGPSPKSSNSSSNSPPHRVSRQETAAALQEKLRHTSVSHEIKRTATMILNDCVNNRWGDEDAQLDEMGRDPIFAFVTALTEGQVADDVALGVLAEVRSHYGSICDDFLSSGGPMQFWKFVDAFVPIIVEVPEESPVLSQTIELIAMVASELLRRDVPSATNLFNDYLFPRLVPTIKQEASTSAKLHLVLRLMYAFSPEDPVSHYQVIKRLITALEETSLFVKALAHLVFLEREFDETLLDYYLYYAAMGIGNTSPQARAFGIAILSVLSEHQLEGVLAFTPQLSSMAKQDYWWEVQAQLLVLGSTVLERVGDWEENWTIVGGLLEIVLDVFRPTSPVTVRKIGLWKLASLTQFNTSLQAAFVKVLLSLPNEDRLMVLGFPSSHALAEVRLLGAEGGVFERRDIVQEWKGLDVLQEVENDVKSQNLEYVEPEHMQVIAAAVINQCETAAENGSTLALDQQWAAHFDSLRYHIFVAMCDPACCDFAVEVVRRFILSSSLQESVLSEGAFLGMLRLLYPTPAPEPADPVDPRCQNTVQDFLRELLVKGDPYSSTVRDVVLSFIKEANPDTVTKLSALLDEMHPTGAGN